MIQRDAKNVALANACVTLGLAPPFNLDRAKTRYRELAKLYHPDAGVIKDAARFADISLAYGIVEKNIDAFGRLNLTVAQNIDEEHSRATDLLKELHEARKQIIEAEKKQKQMAEEARVLRHHYGETKKMSRGVLLGGVLIGIAAIFLGFLAGMMWSAVSPILGIKPSTLRAELSQPDKVPVYMKGMDGVTSTPMMLGFEGSPNISVLLNNGTVKLEGKNASVESTPTLEIRSVITVTTKTIF